MHEGWPKLNQRNAKDSNALLEPVKDGARASAPSWPPWLRHFSRDSRFPADSSPVDLPLHVPIVAMSVKVPVEPMPYIETSFEPEFVT